MTLGDEKSLCANVTETQGHLRTVPRLWILSVSVLGTAQLELRIPTLTRRKNAIGPLDLCVDPCPHSMALK